MLGEDRPSPPRIIVDASTPESTEMDYLYSPLSTASTLVSPSSLQLEFQLLKRHPSFLSVLRHMRTPLCPLVSATTGLHHPHFPTTILAYHLLTSQQLDDLARHFHQVWPPCSATYYYPVSFPAWLGTDHETTVDIHTKRRRFGRFIGLRGCESPVETSDPEMSVIQEETEDEMLVRMEREWLECLQRASQEDSEMALRWKAGGQ
ncbi:hypothetical protein MW887_000095 [Aspergillus wentii]|nr:hypothetical protein MW887_000095 [Aspergillus wentii]